MNFVFFNKSYIFRGTVKIETLFSLITVTNDRHKAIENVWKNISRVTSELAHVTESYELIRTQTRFELSFCYSAAKFVNDKLDVESGASHLHLSFLCFLIIIFIIEL